jgi:ferredoxin
MAVSNLIFSGVDDARVLARLVVVRFFGIESPRRCRNRNRRLFVIVRHRNLRGRVNVRHEAREQRVADREDIMKVVVDVNVCNLHGLCLETVPEVFEIGDDGVLHVLNETPPEGLRAKVDKAVRECPTGAISIEE